MRPPSRRPRGVAQVMIATICVLGGCARDAQPATSGASVPATSASSTTTAAVSTHSSSDQFDPTLHAELVAMFEADQQERTGEGLPPGTKLPPARDYTRAQRLKEIVADHGWPTWSLVGEAGGTAAWVVAQHADFDPDFQTEMLELMRAAVDAGEADPVELAYLEDRVLVNTGQPQRWGTQVRCRAGVPAPATPIVDEATLDDRRTTLGLETLAAYYDQLSLMCADEAADGQGPAG